MATFANGRPGAFDRAFASKLAATGIVYFAAALIGVYTLNQSHNVSPLWPAVAILMAILIRSRRAIWPALMAVCLPGSIAANLLNGETLTLSLALFGADLIDAALGAYLLTTIPTQPFRLDSLKQLGQLIALGGVVAPIVGATSGAAALFLAYDAPFLNTWITWWLSVFTAVCVLMPAMLLWSHGRLREMLVGSRAAETGLIVGLMTAIVAAIFLKLLFVLLFLAMPLLLWAAIRLGSFPASVINIVLAGASIGFLLADLGRATNPVFDLGQRILILQLYIALMAIGPSLTVAIILEERRRAELALLRGEARFRALLDHSPMGIALRTLDGRYLLVNRRFDDWYAPQGQTLAGRMISDVFPQKSAAKGLEVGRQVAVEKGAVTAEYEVPKSDGALHRIHDTVFPVADPDGAVNSVGIFISDVSDLRKSEDQLRQAQKMEAVGQLTGGIAHDFNNLLAIIIGNLELTLENLAPNTPEAQQVRGAFAAAERGSTLTHRLLAFSRRQPLKPRVVNLNDTLRAFHDLLARTLGEHIDLEIVTASGLWLCEVDPAQVESAVLNLAINARDAMPDGGKLTIETANVRLDEAYAAAEIDVKPGQYVMVAVTDTGPGMPDAVRSHAFEPFFTTKAEGKGSGLGLSMIYGFMKQSGGHVKIYSEEGHGTTIKLYLPRSLAGEADGMTRDPGAEMPRGHGETVLVVEDDKDVRSLAATILKDLGYRVLEAKDGESALRQATAEGGIDLLLTDVVLAGEMSGPQVAEALRKKLPSHAVLYMSGYTANAVVHHGRVDPGVELLQKPFRKAELARAVRRAMQQKS